MTCLVCSGPLDDIGAFAWCQNCGYYYPPEILADADPEMWGLIQRKGLACTKCEGLPGMPTVHVNRRGRPVRCRKGRLRFWRWRARQSAPS